MKINVKRCGKSFVHKSLLAKHRSIHVTPHECEICGKKFLHKTTSYTTYAQAYRGKNPFSANCVESLSVTIQAYPIIDEKAVKLQPKD